MITHSNNTPIVTTALTHRILTHFTHGSHRHFKLISSDFFQENVLAVHAARILLAERVEDVGAVPGPHAGAHSPQLRCNR